MIFPEQIRAARALLGLNQIELAKAARIGAATVKRIERASGQLKGTAKTLWRIQQALEKRGVEFLHPDGGDKGPGVRLRAPPKGHSRR